MKKTSTGSRMNLLSILAVIAIVAVVMPKMSEARPSGLISRQKRVSDQRIAELETLLALARLRGKLVTVPVGFGRVDPARIGRKRRSNVQNSLEKLQRVLQAVARDSELVSTENSDDALPSSWNDVDDRQSLELTDQLK